MSSTIEDGVRVVREGACSLVGSVQVEKQAIDNFISTGKAHSQGMAIICYNNSNQNTTNSSLLSGAIDYLNEPSNGIYRAGAIGVGALSGYLLGIRRGFFRKLIYSSAGGVGVASLCYPKEAAVYSNQALAEAKVYATILYNFAYGGMLMFATPDQTYFNQFKSIRNFSFLFVFLQSNQAMNQSHFPSHPV